MIHIFIASRGTMYAPLDADKQLSYVVLFDYNLMKYIKTPIIKSLFCKKKLNLIDFHVKCVKRKIKL